METGGVSTCRFFRSEQGEKGGHEKGKIGKQGRELTVHGFAKRLSRDAISGHKEISWRQKRK